MRFVVSRTSTYGEQPCPEANREGDGPWTVEIADIEALLAFVKRHDDRVIISNWDSDPWEIEIYDDYRE